MREYRRIERYVMSMQELSEVTKEVYGIEFDIQMGERGQGEKEVVDTRNATPDGYQCYWTGLVDSYDPNVKYKNARTVNISDEEMMAKWQAQDVSDSIRPYNKIGENGEYTHIQPDTDLVMMDLAKRGEIPHGEYQIEIDW